MLASARARWKMSRAVSRMRRNCISEEGEIIGGIISSGTQSRMLCGRSENRCTYPGFDRVAHFMQATFEKMVGGLDEDQLLRIGHGIHHGLQLLLARTDRACRKRKVSAWCNSLEN